MPEEYEITGAFVWKKVHYQCPNPRCQTELLSPLKDAGGETNCPDCETSFVIPGRTEAGRRAGRLKNEEQTGLDQFLKSTVRTHLKKVHKEHKSSPRYSNSASHWRNLESKEILDWMAENVSRAVSAWESGANSTVTKTKTFPKAFLVITVVPGLSADRILGEFSPRGYIDNVLEPLGFLGILKDRIPVAAWIVGIEGAGQGISLHLTWMSPLDNRPYDIIWPVDILNAKERGALGI